MTIAQADQNPPRIAPTWICLRARGAQRRPRLRNFNILKKATLIAKIMDGITFLYHPLRCSHFQKTTRAFNKIGVLIRLVFTIFRFVSKKSNWGAKKGALADQ
jgi:hypothetical protein